MQKAKGMIDALNFTHMASQPHSVQAQLAPLERLDKDLHEASIRISHTQFATPPTVDPAHVQLITCFAPLLTALVNKLSHLEGLPASHLAFDCNSGSSSAMYTAFFFLRCLLVTTCHTTARWPRSWPLQGHTNSAPVRDALHSLLTFMLRITRSHNVVWHAVAQQASPGLVHRQMNLILTVPMNYTTGIGCLPMNDMVAELSALPKEFFSLLACLTLEQLEDLSPAEAEATAPFCDADYPGRAEAATRSLPIRHLGEAFNSILRILNTAGRRDCLFMFASPAVAQLKKRILIILSEPKNARLMFDNQQLTTRFLTFFLKIGAEYNDMAAISQTGLDANLMQAGLGSGEHLRLLYRPTVLLSDTRLLRALLQDKRAGSSTVLERYKLLRAVLLSWRGDVHAPGPFPKPSVAGQIRGCYVVAHHCAAKCVSWMQQQRQKCTTQTVVHGSSTGHNPPSPPMTAKEMQYLIKIGRSNTAVLWRLCGLDKATSGCKDFVILNSLSCRFFFNTYVPNICGWNADIFENKKISQRF